MDAKVKRGFCELTGLEGSFVRCHLLPQALTRTRATRGKYFIEAGGGGRAIGRRWNSWYDDQLVGAAGEAILGRLDDWGVKILRRNHLVWSGWAAEQRRLEEEVELVGTNKVRHLQRVDGTKLRLFFLSLLWRASATSREEFSEIEIPAEHIEVLRLALVGGPLPPPQFYPAMIIQYGTRFDDHNRSPIRWRGPDAGVLSPTFKFYVDGMAVLFFGAAVEIEQFGPVIVSSQEDLLVPVYDFEGSEQHRNLLLAASGAWSQGLGR